MKRFYAYIGTSFEEAFLVVSNLKKIEVGLLDRGSASDTINWGIFSNIGSLEFFDNDGQFLSLIKGKTDSQQITVYIFFDSGEDGYKKIATFYMDDYEYDKSSKFVSMSLVDGLEKIQEMPFPSTRDIGETSLKDLLTDEENGFNKKSHVTASLEGEVAQKLGDSAKISVVSLYGKNCWQVYDELCKSFMLRMYVGENGYCISYDHPRDSTEVSVIRARNIFNVSNRTKKEKNAIPSAILKEKNRVIYGSDTEGVLYGDKIGFTLAEVVALPKSAFFSTTVDFRRIFDTDVRNSAIPSIEYNKDTDGNIIGDKATIKIDFPLEKNVHRAFVNSTNLELTKRYWGTGDNYDGTAYEITEKKTIENNDSYEWKDGAISITFTIDVDNRDTETKTRTVLESGTAQLSAQYFVEEKEIERYYKSADADGIEIVSGEFVDIGTMVKDTPIAFCIIYTVEEKYKQGVESVELECDLGTYYDEDGNETKSGTNIFKKYDLVIPYTMQQGVESPLSTNEDGTPKVFKILGIKYLFDGVARQVLHLQEYVEKDPFQEYVEKDPSKEVILPSQ